VKALERQAADLRFNRMKNDGVEHLVKCPQCNAWPMALAPTKNDDVGPNHLTFRCPKCHAQFVYTVGVGGSLVPGPPKGP
jgi:uncharacterized C2H2 Zn-finger protein